MIFVVSHVARQDLDREIREARALARKGIFRGVDLAALAAKLWRLPAMRAEGSLPEIRWRSWSSAWVGGLARTRSKCIILRLGMEADLVEAAEVLLHELVHCACPHREHHGELFRRRLIACARDGFGLTLDTTELLALPAGHHSRRAYAVDTEIQCAMREAKVSDRLLESPVTRYVAPPPESLESKAAKRVAARELRANKNREHAEKMLREWESRLARAKRVSAKWRKRVQYYERRELGPVAPVATAARKGG